jgi:DNA-binding MarR family transcriptional regulator
LKTHDQSRSASVGGALKKVQDDLSLPQLVALLAIGSTPGLSVNELAERIGAPQQSTSRYVSVLTGRYADPAIGGDSRPFITQEVKQDDPRSRALYLAERGRETVQSILDAANYVEEIPHVGR